MLKKQLYFTVTLLLFSSITFAQSSAPILEWARGNHGYNSVLCTAITTDDTGNVYVTGQFKSTPDFDPAPMGFAFLTSNGDYDVFIQKLDPQGNLIWAKSIGGSGVDKASAITVDDSGNVYITGT